MYDNLLVGEEEKMVGFFFGGGGVINLALISPLVFPPQ